MTTPTVPGVHLREVSSGVRPISGASTSTAAFLGAAERGPVSGVRFVQNMTEFTRIYGGFLSDSRLAHAVLAFFANGGSQCYVGRVVNTGSVPGDEAARAAAITLGIDAPGTASAPAPNAAMISASSPGPWGNELQVVISSATADDPLNTFDLEVYRTGGAKPELVEQHRGLSMDPRSLRHVSVLDRASDHVVITPDAETARTESGKGSVTGGKPAEGGLGPARRRLKIGMHGDDLHEIPMELTAEEQGDLAKIAPKLENAVQAVKNGPNAPLNAYRLARVEITDGRVKITSGVAGVDSTVQVARASDPDKDAAGALGFDHDVTSVGGAARLRPRDTPTGTVDMLGDDTVDHPNRINAVVEGVAGSAPRPQDHTAALSRLDTILDVSLLAIPGIGDEAVAGAAMDWCRARSLSDCFFLADMDQEDRTLAQAETWRTNVHTTNSYGAVYFPWLETLNPAGGSTSVYVPPSGFVAGIFARTDATRGVWKTPAGIQAGAAGAIGLATELTDTEHGRLNEPLASVSVIRRFPGTGIVLWGGRTLSSDSEWRYTAVRRTAIFLRVSIARGIQWAVFEPNDEPLWAQLRLNLTAFMSTLFRQGAFAGRTADEAFFVKVDRETTQPADVADGVVNVRVGFAPQRPAEFVVVTLSQAAGRAG